MTSLVAGRRRRASLWAQVEDEAAPAQDDLVDDEADPAQDPAQATAAHLPRHPIEAGEKRARKSRHQNEVDDQAAHRVTRTARRSRQAIRVQWVQWKLYHKRSHTIPATRRTVEATKISRNTISLMTTTTSKLSRRENRFRPWTSSNHLRLSFLPSYSLLLRNINYLAVASITA